MTSGPPGWPAGYAPPAAVAKSSWPGVVAVVLGALGCAVWLLPADLDVLRQYSPLPFAVAGLVLGIIGCAKERRGTAWAVTGTILSGIALALAGIMIVGGLIR